MRRSPSLIRHALQRRGVLRSPAPDGPGTGTFRSPDGIDVSGTPGPYTDRSWPHSPRWSLRDRASRTDAASLPEGFHALCLRRRLGWPVLSGQARHLRPRPPRLGAARAVQVDSMHPTFGIGTRSSASTRCRSLGSVCFRLDPASRQTQGCSRVVGGGLPPRIGTPRCPTARVPGKHRDGNRPSLLDTDGDLW